MDGRLQICESARVLARAHCGKLLNLAPQRRKQAKTTGNDWKATGNWSGQAAGSGEGFDLAFQAIGQLIECRLAKRLTKQVRQV
jgi:hypothetical protein